MAGVLERSFTSAFDKKSERWITNVETTVMKTERILRYDITIKNTGNRRIVETYDYSRHHRLGLEIAVRPNGRLVAVMEMQRDNMDVSKVKAASRDGGVLVIVGTNIIVELSL